jgi:hypothetical protein
LRVDLSLAFGSGSRSLHADVAAPVVCCHYSLDFSFGSVVWIVAGDSPGVLLSHRIESLEDLWSKLFSRGSFLNTPIRCSVK